MHWSAFSAVEQAVAAMKMRLRRDSHWRCHDREDEPVDGNNASTITSIYSDGQLKMYTSHPTQPTSPEGRPEYCMTQLNGYSMTSDPETFRKGEIAYRNARD
jgi:hypothetical protein